MNNKDFYQETFSQVHGSRTVTWEDCEHMRKRHSIGKRLFMLAAVIAVAAALSGLAIAVNFLGLRDTLLPEQYGVYKTDEYGKIIPGEYEYTDFISLSGFNDTPESQALAEWQSFLEGYDQDGSIIASVGNNPTGFEDRYGMYLVYTQEMADKLEEIIAKYDLRLHSWMEVILPEVWPLAVGDFMAGNNTAWSGYIYEDGTFQFDGEAELPGYGKIDYQFRRTARGTFNDVMLNVGDLSGFQEWNCQTSCGVTVTLGLGPQNRSLLIADLGDSFVTVNVLTGMEGDDTFSSGGIGRAELEAFADLFDFTVLSPVSAPDRNAILSANERYMSELESAPIETLPSESEDPLYIRTGIQYETAKEFVLLLAERIENGEKEEIAGMLAYPVQIETSDNAVTVETAEEFLSYYDQTIGENARSLTADMTWEPTPEKIFSDGSGLASAANGAVWFGLTEDGVIRVFTLQTDQWSIRPASGISQDEPYVSLSLDESRTFLLELADDLAQGRKEDAADRLSYPAQVKAPDGEWVVNTPEEFLEHYNESAGATLAADLQADPEPVLDGGGGLASAADGSVRFGRSQDGSIRVFALQSDVWLWSVQYCGSEQP